MDHRPTLAYRAHRFLRDVFDFIAIAVVICAIGALLFGANYGCRRINAAMCVAMGGDEATCAAAATVGGRAR